WSNGGTVTVAQLIPVPGKDLSGEVVALNDPRLDPDPGAQWWNMEPPGPRAPAIFQPRACEHAGQAGDSSGVEWRGKVPRWSADLALAKRIAGCYELARGSWQTDSTLARFGPMPRGPVRFELTNIPDPNWTRLAANNLTTYFETRS